MNSFIRTLIYFLILNLVLNWVYRVSPALGALLFFGYIAFIISRGFRGRSFTQRTNMYQSQQTTQQTPPPNFKKDPNVIDAEFSEHKPNNFN